MHEKIVEIYLLFEGEQVLALIIDGWCWGGNHNSYV